MYMNLIDCKKFKYFIYAFFITVISGSRGHNRFRLKIYYLKYCFREQKLVSRVTLHSPTQKRGLTSTSNWSDLHPPELIVGYDP